MIANEHDDNQPDSEDVIDALRVRVEAMRQANVGMEAERDQARLERDEAIRQSQGYLETGRDCLDQIAALRDALTETESILSTLALSSIRRALIVIQAALRSHG